MNSIWKKGATIFAPSESRSMNERGASFRRQWISRNQVPGLRPKTLSRISTRQARSQVVQMEGSEALNDYSEAVIRVPERSRRQMNVRIPATNLTRQTLHEHS